MKAEDVALGGLLNLDRRHLIPTYQRDYEWTEEGQWELLMDDVLDVTDRLVRARETAEARGADPTNDDATVAPHFLGAIVLQVLQARGAHVQEAWVIDGQQRLTTIYLLLRGLLDAMIDDSLKRRARQVHKLVFLDEDDVIDEEEVYKLWPRRRDRQQWVSAMSPTPTSEHRYVAARQYFADRIKAAADSAGAAGTDAQKFFGALVDALAHKIKLVVVYLENLDDAQLIFEVLNGRQTPLSAADLVKNLLFMRAEVSEAEVDELYDRYWAPFDQDWWGGNIGRGHASRGRRDQLLATWLTIQTADEVNLGHLYGEARVYLRDTTEKLPEILSSIHDLAREYRQIYERPNDMPPAIAEVYRRMEKLGVTTAVPLLAWLRTIAPERLPQEQHVRAAEAIDSFVTRRLIAGGQTRGYGRAFLEVLKHAKSAGPQDDLAEAVVQGLLNKPYGLDWPTDKDLAESFTDRRYYGSVSQERIRMILGPIDAHMQRGRSKSEHAHFDYDSLTIEHVMPRSWKSRWPVSGSDTAAKIVATDNRERHVNRIGNLTLVTKALNPSMSNAAWTKKREALRKQSVLALNAEIVANEIWNEEEIDRRSGQLAKIACQVWKRPA